MIYAILLIVSVALIPIDRQAYDDIIEASSDPTCRSMERFAEEEIVLPKDGGPYEGERFSCDFQPFSRLFFREIDSGHWVRIAATGPTQAGKTLLCHVIPACYHLFERNEHFVDGIPDMRVAQDKWQVDFGPIIDASEKFRALRPIRGEGSEGGQVKSAVTFRNGAILRFMTAASRDTGRASFTAPALGATEIDNYGKRAETSEETDKVSQLEGRLRAKTLLLRRVYLECTVTTKWGRIWQEVKNGSDSRIVCQCPLCGAQVTPEREHLKGWQEAESEREAHEKTRWHCPECDGALTEEQREEMNQGAVLCHKGQEVTPEGEVIGEPPPTFTLGFRWNAFNNLFLSAGDIGVDEWNAQRSVDRDSAERKLCQQVHCLPYEDPDVDLEPLDFATLSKKARRKKGIVPLGSQLISVGIDTAKRRLDWMASAWKPDGSGQVIEYGEHPVNWEKLRVTGGLKAALLELADYFRWEIEGGGQMVPLQVWIDSGYSEHRDGVYEFCREINKKLGCRPGREVYRPAKGYGERQRQMQRYRHPKKKTQEICYLGRDYYMSKVPGAGVLLVHVNADVWKSEFHRALAKDADDPGSLVLYEGPPEEHRGFFDQITAEERREIHEEGRGMVVYWHTKRRKNHMLDAGYLAQTAGHFALECEQNRRPAKKKPSDQPKPDTEERAFLASQR